MNNKRKLKDAANHLLEAYTLLVDLDPKNAAAVERIYIKLNQAAMAESAHRNKPPIKAIITPLSNPMSE